MGYRLEEESKQLLILQVAVHGNLTPHSSTNRQWEESLQLLLRMVKTELGCDSEIKVTCELYKLQLYKSGGYFKVRINQISVV